MDEKVRKLTKKQLEKLNSFNTERKLFDKDCEISKLRRELSERELKLFSANYTLKSKEVEELKVLENQMRASKKSEEEKRKEYIEKIKKDHGLSQKWGYDPLTGEIKDD
tara:strand:- start:6520 stop:6846 length:327 start_codon:yes stop_codon:yes gene_type:complete